MGTEYRFSFASHQVDVANMLLQTPFCTAVEEEEVDGDSSVTEVVTAKRSVAIMIAQVLVAEDVSFSMTVKD